MIAIKAIFHTHAHDLLCYVMLCYGYDYVHVFSSIFDETNVTVSWPPEKLWWMFGQGFHPFGSRMKLDGFNDRNSLLWILVAKLSEILQTKETLTTASISRLGSLKTLPVLLQWILVQILLSTRLSKKQMLPLSSLKTDIIPRNGHLLKCLRLPSNDPDINKQQDYGSFRATARKDRVKSALASWLKQHFPWNNLRKLLSIFF